MISRRQLQTSLFAVFLFASALISQPTHAYQILTEPTGTCPDYLAAVNDPTVATGLPNKYKLEKQPMKCKQGMCWRPQIAGGESTLKTDIPCNYSVDDIFVTVLGVVRMIFALTGAVALLMFVIGGMYWVLSAGDSGKVKKGKEILVNSIIAICITFGAGAIVTLVTKSIGAEIGTGTNSVGQIVVDPDTTPDCPINGKQGEDCNDNEETNMVCYYGPDVAHGAQAATQGICIDNCRYQSLPPDPWLVNDAKGTYQCTEKSTLTPTQQQTCKTQLCPGVPSVQCCKL